MSRETVKTERKRAGGEGEEGGERAEAGRRRIGGWQCWHAMASFHGDRFEQSISLLSAFIAIEIQLNLLASRGVSIHKTKSNADDRDRVPQEQCRKRDTDESKGHNVNSMLQSPGTITTSSFSHSSLVFTDGRP